MLIGLLLNSSIHSIASNYQTQVPSMTIQRTLFHPHIHYVALNNGGTIIIKLVGILIPEIQKVIKLKRETAVASLQAHFLPMHQNVTVMTGYKTKCQILNETCLY